MWREGDGLGEVLCSTWNGNNIVGQLRIISQLWVRTLDLCSVIFVPLVAYFGQARDLPVERLRLLGELFEAPLYLAKTREIEMWACMSRTATLVWHCVIRQAIPMLSKAC